MSRWIHMCHLKDAPLVKEGDYVNRGDLVGYIGNTGASKGAHLHLEIMLTKPTDWHFYPNGLTKRRVEALYQNPEYLFQDGIPCEFAYKGWGWLQWNGSVFHPGIDANSPHDFGKPLYSPINGRVQFVSSVSWIRRFKGRLIPSVWNHGFGNHLWIEADEINPGITKER